MLGIIVFVSLNTLIFNSVVNAKPYFDGTKVLPYGNGTDVYDERLFFLQPINNSNNNAATCVSTTTCCRYRCAAVTSGGMMGQLASECATGAMPGMAANRCITSAGTAATLAPGAPCIFSLSCPACFNAGAAIACIGQQECTTILGNGICPWT